MFNERVRSTLPGLPIHVSNPPRTHSDPGSISNLHYHAELEFIVIYDGSFFITVDGVDYNASSGDVIFVNSGVPHSTYSTTPVKTALVQFRETDFLNSSITKIIKYSVKFNNLTESKMKVLKNKNLFEALCRIITESYNKDPAFEIFVRSEIYKVLGLLYRDGILLDTESFFATKEIQKILPALEYINKNFADNVTLEDVSSILGFDASYFCRIFRSATGATFTEYLNFVRICKAEKLLATTKDSILEISESVGFSSLSYFNRVFKKIRNCSPGSYRQAELV